MIIKEVPISELVEEVKKLDPSIQGDVVYLVRDHDDMIRVVREYNYLMGNINFSSDFNWQCLTVCGRNIVFYNAYTDHAYKLASCTVAIAYKSINVGKEPYSLYYAIKNRIGRLPR